MIKTSNDDPWRLSYKALCARYGDRIAGILITIRYLDREIEKIAREKPKKLMKVLDTAERLTDLFETRRHLYALLLPSVPECKQALPSWFSLTFIPATDGDGVMVCDYQTRRLLFALQQKPSGEVVFYGPRKGEQRLLKSTPAQRKAIKGLFDRIRREVNKRNARIIADRKRRENTGARESIHDLWTLKKAGKAKD